MSEGHALLSPSAAARWLNCTLAPRLEATIPEKTNEYAEEGTLAHSVCEVTARLHFKKIKKATYTATIKRLKQDALWDDEMLTTAETYVGHLMEKAMAFKNEPYVAFEIKVDLSDYIPEGYGRCDCVMFGNDTLIISDYKHGKGVSVSAENNPQMMLYALGALKLYRPLFGDAIKTIEMCIDQPRINIYESWSCTSDELLAWGENIKPIAQSAFDGVGEYKAGDWCRFCRANGQCKAQAQQQISALDDFNPTTLADESGAVVKTENIPPSVLTPEEISEVLKRGKLLVAWYKAVEEHALEVLLNGEAIPGYKVVEGKSNRTWTNQDAAMDTLQQAGYDRAVLYDNVPKTLAQLEKLIGTTKFTELVGQFIVKPQGKPTLADENDKRAAFNSAASDFAGVAQKQENN